MATLKKKSITGFIWDFIGRLGLQGVGFFVSIILARILIPEDFGLLALITVFINLANVFLDFGFSTALVQRSKVTEEHYSSVFFMNVFVGFLLGILVFLSAPYVAHFYDNYLLINLIRVMSLSFVINAFGNVTRAHLRREMNFKLVTIANITAAFASGFIAVFMAYNGFGVWSLVIQILISQLLSNIIIYFGCKLRFKLFFKKKAAIELWGFSSKIFYSGLIDTIFLNLDSLLIGKLFSSATLGYYYRAKSLEGFSIRYTSGAISSVLLPSLSSLQNDVKKFDDIVIKSFHILAFVSFLLSGLLFVSAEEIVILLFSDKWKSSIIYFQIIIIGAFSSQLFTICYNTLLSKGKSDEYLLINSVSKILSILSLIILFNSSLLNYLLIATLIKIITFFLALYYTVKILEIERQLYFLIGKHILIYSVSIILIWYFNELFEINNFMVSLMINSSLYMIIFIFLSKLFIPKSYNIVLIEVLAGYKSIIKKKTSEKIN